MSSLVEDFAFIAKRAHEIRTARYLELGVSPPSSPEPLQQGANRPAPAQGPSGGFRYAPGFEHLAQPEPVADAA
jgi:hypothetical protein